MAVFDNLDGFVRITGAQANSFRDSFAREVVVGEPENGRKKASALRSTNDYIILVEWSGGVLHFEVRLGTGKGSFVAFGPNIVQKHLMDNTVTRFKMSPPIPSYPEYATAAG